MAKDAVPAPLKRKVEIYTDGACKGNPGPGGYGAILIYKDARREVSGGSRWTTNNRMELIALIKALSMLLKPCSLEIRSDSKYLLNGLGKGWMEKWKKTGWTSSSKQPVLNSDLWKRLDALIAPHQAKFHWVKGHSSNKENCRCDEMASLAAIKPQLPADQAYEACSPPPKKEAQPRSTKRNSQS